MLPFKTRRTSQPQGAVELSNAPLAKGILIALPLGGSRLNSVGSDRRLASAVGAGSGVSAKGVAAKFSGSDYISLGTAPLLASTTPCAFSIYEESFGTNPYTSLLGLTASGSPNQFLFIRGSDPAYGCALSPANSATNARNFSGAGVQTAGERIRFFVTCANGLGSYTGIRVWADGVELSEGTTTFGDGAAGTSYVGWDGYDSKFIGLLSDFVLWGRVPSDAEIKAYFDSPGQIYASQSRSLWIPGTVSGGGAATVIPIGQQATGSVGTLVATGAAKALPAGVSASSAVGTPVAVGGSSIPATVTPAGVSATGAVGTATATGQAKAYPAGVSATASVGSPVALAGGAAVATPSGVQAVGAVGNLISTGASWVVPGGVSASGAVGTPVASGGAAVAAVAYPVGLVGFWSVGSPTINTTGIEAVSGAATRPSRIQVYNRAPRYQTGARHAR